METPDLAAVAPPLDLEASRPARVWLRWVELLVMFVVIPSVLAVFIRPGLTFPAIWLLGGVSLAALMLDKSFDRTQLWNARAVRSQIIPILKYFIPCSILLTLALWAYEPERLFGLLKDKPAVWVAIMVGYPVLSVVPQEIGFRAFFSHRYRRLFRSEDAYVIVNALAFSYAHIIMHNAFALAMCFIGGLLMAVTYERSRSTLAVSIEHAMYGCLLFTIGWGYYFFGGAVRP